MGRWQKDGSGQQAGTGALSPGFRTSTVEAENTVTLGEDSPKLKFFTIKHQLPIPLPPAPDNHHSTFCHYELDYSRYFT